MLTEPATSVELDRLAEWPAITSLGFDLPDDADPASLARAFTGRWRELSIRGTLSVMPWLRAAERSSVEQWRHTANDVALVFFRDGDRRLSRIRLECAWCTPALLRRTLDAVDTDAIDWTLSRFPRLSPP